MTGRTQCPHIPPNPTTSNLVALLLVLCVSPTTDMAMVPQMDIRTRNGSQTALIIPNLRHRTFHALIPDDHNPLTPNALILEPAPCHPTILQTKCQIDLAPLQR